MNHPFSQVTITGGAGFIGRHFTRRLGARGIRVSTVDIRSPVSLDDHERAVVGDVRDPAALRVALEGSDAVLHLAAAHHDFGIDEKTFFSVNEGGAVALCDAMDEAGITSLCFFSSVAVYGPDAKAPAEDHPCKPDSPYGASKLAAETVFRRWARSGGGREVLVIRPTVTFGPGNFANMYTLIRQVASGFYLPVGPGTNRKSLVYVDNLLAATLTLWASPGDAPIRIFNAVDKPDLSSRAIEEVVHRGLGRTPPRLRLPLGAARVAVAPFDAVIAMTGRNLPISSARIRKFAEANTVFSAEKLAAEGIRPEVGLEEGIERMVEWYLEFGRHLPVDRSIPPADPLPFGAEEAHYL